MSVFSTEVFDYLESEFTELFKNSPEEEYRHFFIDTGNELLLNLAGKKAIIDNCIFGVDIDPEAVEVTKMSLALKIIDNNDIPQITEQIGLFGEQILNVIGLNIRCGNSLVDSSIFVLSPELLENEEDLLKTNVFDWSNDVRFQQIFKEYGGFDFIVGNPPYVEVKHFKEELPYMHHFIKETYTTGNNGKIDLAVPFIERSLSVLNDQGRLGFIVQKRFFKTDYGKNIRELITEGNYISSIVDFETNEIFKRHYCNGNLAIWIPDLFKLVCLEYFWIK